MKMKKCCTESRYLTKIGSNSPANLQKKNSKRNDSVIRKYIFLIEKKTPTKNKEKTTNKK